MRRFIKKLLGIKEAESERDIDNALADLESKIKDAAAALKAKSEALADIKSDTARVRKEISESRAIDAEKMRSWLEQNPEQAED